MKLFKKFTNKISRFGKRIYNSRGFEIATFTYDSITACVDFHKALVDFIDHMKLVVASIFIIGKWAIRGISKCIPKFRDIQK